MDHIIESLISNIGLSSNKLLKGVLLNTAIELFSFIVASPDPSSGYLYHDWTMEDFEDLYNAVPDTGPILESTDVWIPSLASDGMIDEVKHMPSVVQDTNFITSQHEQDTIYLPMPDKISIQDEQVNVKLDNNLLSNLSTSESFYYLVGPVNVWLEFPFALDMEATPAQTNADDENFTDHDFNCYLGTEFSFLNASLRHRSEEGIEELLLQSENHQLDSYSTLLNYETEAKDTILWDSYDLHLSRSPMQHAHTNLSFGWENEDLSTMEDLITLMEEEMMLLSRQDKNLLSTDLHPNKMLAKKLPTSTPCMKKTRPRGFQTAF
ncbi:uncharacterized protein [Engystomops pustulosus]|uniref:uncharacterized protein n=1 Tax=Engystomops pustulosus TaxID=76066 RepID=UPI003AFA8EF5